MPDVMFSREARCHLGAGHFAQQNWLAFSTWAMALLELRPARVIELGTGKGGFALMLARLCQAIRCDFFTFDHKLDDSLIHQLCRLGGRAQKADLYSAEIQAEIANLIQMNGQTVLLCDGGNKVREMHDFASTMKPGDIIAAHDYIASPEAKGRVWRTSEITLEDVSDLLHECEQWRTDWFDQAAWLVLRKSPTSAFTAAAATKSAG